MLVSKQKEMVHFLTLTVVLVMESHGTTSMSETFMFNFMGPKLILNSFKLKYYKTDSMV